MARTAQHGSVANVPPPLEDYNLFLSSRPLAVRFPRDWRSNWRTPVPISGPGDLEKWRYYGVAE